MPHTFRLLDPYLTQDKIIIFHPGADHMQSALPGCRIKRTAQGFTVNGNDLAFYTFM
jgi:predicted thioesterase